MRLIFCAILILTLISCSVSSSNKGETSNKNACRIIKLHTNHESNSLLTSSEDTFDPDDCTYLQSEQTDEFLRNSTELKGYVWDSISKTATIVLSENETLLVRRGGCYDYCVSAEFIINDSNVDYSEWNNVFKKVLWIA